MNIWQFSYLTILFATAGLANSSGSSYHAQSALERLEHVPAGWLATEPPHADSIYKLSIALHEAEPDALHNAVYQVSQPAHSRYGKHLSRTEANALLQPLSHHTDAVLEWLEHAGISASDIQTHSNWITVNTTVLKAEQLLSTSFKNYRHRTGHVRTRSLEYSVPEHLQASIKMIHPVTHFAKSSNIAPTTKSRLKKRQSTSSDSVNCSQEVAPSCLRSLYNFPPFDSPLTCNNSANILGVNSFFNDYFQYESLELFLDEYAPWASNASNITWTSISGGKELQGPDESGSGEADLDVQYAVSLAWPYAVHVFSDGVLTHDVFPDHYVTHPEAEDWIGYLQFILDLPDDQLPTTFSTSYADDEQNFSEQYTDTACKMFGQLAARGVSFIVGSGDIGAGLTCEENFGNNKTAFTPGWPSVCPYVTSVGGTQGRDPEVVWDGSGGGFSNRFTRPTWQEDAVQGYLDSLGDQFAGLYNRTGRGYPDIAAQAVDFLQRDSDDGGNADASTGTSASTPVIASIFVLVNGARINAGKPPLGFLNPWIYEKGYKALTDIVDGKQIGCEYGRPDQIVPDAAFNATVGWDPVTGFGTPNVMKLIELALED